MLLDWLGEHWLELAGTLLSAGALFFAWRNWHRSKSFVAAELRPLAEQKMGAGADRRLQLTLPVTVWAKRNDAYIADTFLVAGKDRVRGASMSYQRDAHLRVGVRAYRYWYRDIVRYLSPREPWRIYWQDSEGRLHRAGTVSREDVRRLVGD